MNIELEQRGILLLIKSLPTPCSIRHFSLKLFMNNNVTSNIWTKNIVPLTKEKTIHNPPLGLHFCLVWYFCT